MLLMKQSDKKKLNQDYKNVLRVSLSQAITNYMLNNILNINNMLY